MMLDLISRKESKVTEFNNGDKIGYALGDFGCATFFAFVSSYLMLFYTDILGISAASVGTLFIVARIWDAINDPIMGVIVDKTKTSKHGKFRPFVVKFGVPMVCIGILAFTAIPMLPENLKLPYAYVTYILYGMLYTAVNIPYGSLASVMTDKEIERTALSTFRNLGSMTANILVMIIVPKIVFAVDGSVTAGGFMQCAIILAIISTVSFIFSFRLTKERIVRNDDASKENKEKVGIGQTIKFLLKNRAFVGVALASFTMMGSMLTVSTLNVYLFKDYFRSPALTAIGGMIGMIASLTVMPIVGSLVKKFGKKESAVLGGAFASIVYAVLFFIPNMTPVIYIVLSFVAGLGTGVINTLVWALVGDAIDYQEYISGERKEGIVYSSYSLARKLAQAISGGIGGFALSILGYQAGAAQQAESVGIGIKNIILGLPAVGYLITTLVLMFVYNLSRNKLKEIKEELDNRRA